ncbi:hypothetical protein ACIBJF_06530 [Streptomyces sp. NPDC050743]|uniref:hypothetical protein n=1 Tax=Streptomyces sp. NPDC050743 TaxID=3365634 RepID=UPI0037B20EAC
MSQHEDILDAARMVALALARGKAPARSGEYARLVRRFETEPDFAQIVRKIAQGFDLTVLEVHRMPGLVLGTTPETDFAVSVADLVPQTADRPLYLLAQLAIASLAFPRPEDLDDDAYVGRVSVKQVDEEVRSLARAIEHRLAQTDADTDPPADQPGLEGLWRAYLRRNATGTTRADKTPRTVTYSLVRRALTHLAEHGFVRKVSDEDAGTYATSVKYRLQIRDQAAGDMLRELAALGVAALPSRDQATTSESAADSALSADDTLPGSPLPTDLP